MLVLLLLVSVIAVGAWWLTQPQQARRPADASSVQSAQGKVDAFVAARARAVQSGRPVSVSQTFSDAELSSLANEQAEAKGMPISEISLHATSRGVIEGQGQALVSGRQVPVSIEGVPEVSEDNRLRLRITTVKLGPVPVPGPLADQVTSQIRRSLEFGQPLTGFTDVRVTSGDGQVTLSGVAQPR